MWYKTNQPWSVWKPSTKSWKDWFSALKFWSWNSLGWFWDMVWYHSTLYFPWAFFPCLKHYWSAIYSFIPLSWHPWTVGTWSLAPTYQGDIQNHLVEWVGEYLILTHGPTVALDILEDIDHQYANYNFIFLLSVLWLIWILNYRISAIPPFPGLHQFPDGCDYNQ